ncbi:unnamed protein product [Symbiodinium sp. CCMP2592]|nr:unnamed protein product [Symbiodinium sp. CCMP2592]
MQRLLSKRRSSRRERLRQRKSSFSQRLSVLLSRASVGLRNISCESPHAALVWLHQVISASIEADGLVVHVQPSSPQLPVALLAGQHRGRVALVVFDPHSPPGVIAESQSMIQVPWHVLNVTVQAHDDALGSESPFVAVGHRISGGSNDPHWAHRAVGAEHGEMDGWAADGWPQAGEVQLAFTFAGEWQPACEDLPSGICNLEGGAYLGSFLYAGSTGSVLPGLMFQSRGLLINQCTVSWPVCRCIRYLTSYRGMRVGEASHPGPGQNAQKWKRAAQQQAAQLKQIMQLLQALLGCIKGGGIAEIGPSDWHGTVLPYENLEQELRNRGSGPIVVLVGSAQEADVAAQLVAGHGRHAAWILYRERQAQLTVPMMTGGQLRPQHVCCQSVPCLGVAFPSLKSAPRPKAAPTNATCPMRVIVCSSLAAESLWKSAASQPRRFLQDWVKQVLPGQLRGVVQDSWGFAEGQRSGNKVVTGLIRIDTAVVIPLLAVSGRLGVFLEPVAHHPAYPNAVVDWQRPAPGESWAQLCQRLGEQKPAYGLVLGGRQLGLRRAPGADYAPKTLWQIVGTPVHWSDSFLRELIVGKTPAASAEILRRQVRGRRCTWWVRAAIPGGEDAHCLVAAEGAQELNVWMLPSTAKPPPRKPGRPIVQQGAFSLFRAPFEQVDRPSTAIPVSDDLEVDADGDGDADAGTRPSPPPKRAAANFVARVLPEGAQVHPVPGDGACFFHAVSKALEVLHDRKVSAAQARAETVAHLRRYPDAYIGFWGHVDDHGQFVESYSDYLTRMASADAWAGHMELVACAKTLKICLLILPEDTSRITCCFGNPAHPPVALFHTRNHYDLILPSEGTVYPGVIMDIAKEGPDPHIPRAGSSAPSSAPSGLRPFVAGRGRPLSTPSIASSAPTAYRLARARQPNAECQYAVTPPAGDSNRGGDGAVNVERSSSASASVHNASIPAPTTPEMIADLPDDWKCDWCDFVAKAPRLPEFRVPAAADVVAWSNAPKATRAVISAATARRLLKHRSGGFGNHQEIEFYRIPWMGSKHKKARASRMVYVCTACMQTADTPNRIKSLTCVRGPGSSPRAGFIARLRKCITEDHPSELLDGARALLDRLTGDAPSAPRRFTGKRKPPPALRKHDILALAWPTVWRRAYTFRLRFICKVCCASQSTRANLGNRPCGVTVRGAARLRRQLEDAVGAAGLRDDPVVAHGLRIRSDTVAVDTLRLGTLNVATLAGRVATVIALCVTLGLDILALQETRVPQHSRASVEAAFAKAGWHCTLGPSAVSTDGKPLYGTAIVSRVPVVPFALPETLLPQGRGCGVRVHRAVGRPVLCTNLYLPASSETQAASHLRDVFSFLASTGEECVLLGDYNLTAQHAPLSEVRALGTWRLADEVVLGDCVMPPTRRDKHGQPCGRCVDFALSTAGLPALARQQNRGPADHDLVSYDFSFARDLRSVPRAPGRLPLVSTAGRFDFVQISGLIV